MTDRVKGFTVVLKEDVRVDDVEATMNAIAMIKGVCEIYPHIVDAEDEMNRMRIKSELRKKFYDFIDKNF